MYLTCATLLLKPLATLFMWTHPSLLPGALARRYFPSISGPARVRLLESLCSNLSVLVASTGRMLAVEEGERQGATAAHRSALKVHACT